MENILNPWEIVLINIVKDNVSDIGFDFLTDRTYPIVQVGMEFFACNETSFNELIISFKVSEEMVECIPNSYFCLVKSYLSW